VGGGLEIVTTGLQFGGYTLSEFEGDSDADLEEGGFDVAVIRRALTLHDETFGGEATDNPTGEFHSVGEGRLGANSAEHDVVLSLMRMLPNTGPMDISGRNKMVRELLEARQRVSGLDDVQTLQVEAYLANVLGEKETVQESRAMFEGLIPKMEARNTESFDALPVPTCCDLCAYCRRRLTLNVLFDDRQMTPLPLRNSSRERQHLRLTRRSLQAALGKVVQTLQAKNNYAYLLSAVLEDNAAARPVMQE